MEYNVSVIIALYNAKEYINDCINGILAQSLSDIEVVVVNDCSTDDSYEVVRAEFGNNPNVQIINQPINGGPGLARNAGIKAARGKYIAFVDSDDGLPLNALEDMWKVACETEADVVHGTKVYVPLMEEINEPLYKLSEYDMCLASFSRGDDILERTILPDNTEENIEQWLQHRYHWSVWNKLYRTDFLRENNIEFGKLKMAEDQIFCLGCLVKAKRYVILPGGFYIYRLVENSLSRGKYSTAFACKIIDASIGCADVVRKALQGVSYFDEHPQRVSDVINYILGGLEAGYLKPCIREVGIDLLLKDENVKKRLDDYTAFLFKEQYSDLPDEPDFMRMLTSVSFWQKKKLYDIGVSDRQFYYFSTGEDTSFALQAIFHMKSEVSGERLKKAVKLALADNWAYSMKLVRGDNKLYYKKNENEPCVIKEDNKIRYFGSEDTNRYLWYIAYEENKIRLSFFHGVSDTAGMMIFMRKVLCYYLDVEDKVLEAYAPVSKERDIYRVKGNEKGIMDKPVDMYVLPNEPLDEGEDGVRVCDISFSESSFIKLVKENHTSPVPFMAAVIGDAISGKYNIEDHTILAMVPADVRDLVGENVSDNCSLSLFLPYDKTIKDMPFEEKCQSIRNTIKEQKNLERFQTLFYGQTKAGDDFEKADGDFLDRVNERLNMSKKAGRIGISYVLTYASRMNLVEAIDNQVAGIEYNMHYNPIMKYGIIVFIVDGIMTVRINQFSRTDWFSRLIADELGKYPLELSYVDYGNKRIDRLVLEKIEALN
jgi:glycosyltransferase involved in cell wall biosynthesis